MTASLWSIVKLTKQVLNTPSPVPPLGKEIAASEIVDRQLDTFEVIPPNDRRDVARLLPHRPHKQPKRG